MMIEGANPFSKEFLDLCCKKGIAWNPLGWDAGWKLRPLSWEGILRAREGEVIAWMTLREIDFG